MTQVPVSGRTVPVADTTAGRPRRGEPLAWCLLGEVPGLASLPPKTPGGARLTLWQEQMALINQPSVWGAVSPIPGNPGAPEQPRPGRHWSHSSGGQGVLTVFQEMTHIWGKAERARPRRGQGSGVAAQAHSSPWGPHPCQIPVCSGLESSAAKTLKLPRGVPLRPHQALKGQPSPSQTCSTDRRTDAQTQPPGQASPLQSSTGVHGSEEAAGAPPEALARLPWASTGEPRFEEGFRRVSPATGESTPPLSQSRPDQGGGGCRQGKEAGDTERRTGRLMIRDRKPPTLPEELRCNYPSTPRPLR